MTSTLVRANRPQARKSMPTTAPHPTPARRAAPPRHWWQSTLAFALAGGALMWASYPPLDLGWLGWIAPLPWLALVMRTTLDGRWPYASIYLGGFVYWLGLLHFLRLPHPAMFVGWIALAAYVACYVPAFVGLARVAVHQMRWPLWIAAPVVWTALELTRARALTGFSFAPLAHTQHAWIEIVQICDVAGSYALSFVMMAVAACLAQAIVARSARRALAPAAIGLVLVAATWGYGRWRTAGEYTAPGPTVALIQGSVDTEMKWDPALAERVQQEYLELSWQAVRGRSDIDLVVWPETMYREPLITHSEDAAPEPGEDWTVPDVEAAEELRARELYDVVRSVGVPMLIGLDGLNFGNQVVDSTNSAILVDTAGEILARYDKMHPVIFSHEYIPLGPTFPVIYRMLGLRRGLMPGRTPTAVDMGDGVRGSVSICYENILPHLIARQVRELRAAGQGPQVLINQTNDGWFWGSSELDLHLTSAAFRAVECRMPMLVAANTGFSAHIDGDGRVLAQGPRRAEGIIIAQVEVDRRASPYLAVGDWPAGACLAATGLVAVVGLRNRRRQHQPA